MSCPCTGTSAIVSTLAIATLITAAAVGVIRSENLSSHHSIALSQVSATKATAVIKKAGDSANLAGDSRG